MANRFFYWVRERIEDVAVIANSNLYVALLTEPVSEDDLWNARVISDMTSLAEYAAPGYERQPLINPELSANPDEEGHVVCAGALFGVLEPGDTGPAVGLLLFITQGDPADDDLNEPVASYSLEHEISGDGSQAITVGWPRGVLHGPSREEA